MRSSNSGRNLGMKEEQKTLDSQIDRRSKEYNRLRNSSVVTINDINEHQDELKEVKSIKDALEIIKDVIQTFESKEATTEKEYISAILLEKGTKWIGKTSEGKIYKELLEVKDSETPTLTKNQIDIEDYEPLKINDTSFVLINYKNSNILNEKDVFDKTDSQKLVKKKEIREPKVKFEIESKEGNIFRCRLLKYNEGAMTKNIEVLEILKQNNHARYFTLVYNKEAKRKNLFQFILKKIEFAEISLVQTLSDSGDAIAICFRENSKSSIEKIATFIESYKHQKSDGPSLEYKIRFTRKILTSSISSNDKTTVMIWPDYKKNRAFCIGTRLGNIFIYDVKYPGRFFKINTHKYFITDLYLKFPEETKSGKEIKYNVLVSISRDMKISETNLIDLNSIDILSLKNYFFFDLNEQGKLRLIKRSDGADKYDKMIENWSDIADFNKNDLNKDDQKSFTLKDFPEIKLVGHHQFVCDKIEQGQEKIHLIKFYQKEYAICAGKSKDFTIYKKGEILDNKTIFQDPYSPPSSGETIPKAGYFHKDNITSLCSFENFLVSGSDDGEIKIWNLNIENATNLKINPLDTFSPPVSHSNSITCLAILPNQRVILSSSYDLSIKIWKLKIQRNSSQNNPKKTEEDMKMTDEDMIKRRSERMLIYTIPNLRSIVRFIVSIKNGDYFITCCAFGNINIWSSQTYTAILTMSLNTTVKFFYDVEDSKETEVDTQKKIKTIKVKNYIVYSDGKRIFNFIYNIDEKRYKITENASEGSNQYEENIDTNSVNPNNIRLLGYNMNELYQAMKYFRDCMKTDKQSPPFDPVYDKFVIFPFLLTSQHIYAFNNLPDHLKKSLHNGTVLNESTLKQSPLSIAVSKDYEDCTEAIVKFMKNKLNDSPYFINFISDTSLIEMNYLGRDTLTVFYKDLLVRVNKSTNPRFCPLSMDLPLHKPYPDAVVNYNFLFQSEFQGKKSIEEEKSNSIYPDEIFIADSGKSVDFLRSAVSLSLIPGSKRSLALMHSVALCKNINIYSTPFIKAYIDYKWPIVISIMSIHAALYCFYILCLMIFLSMSEVSNIVVGSIFICKVILFFFEIYKIIAFGKNYFSNHWNVLDFIRMLVANFLFIMIIYEFILVLRPSIYLYIRSAFFIITLISYVRSVSFFRLMERTRTFTHLLWEIFTESIPFMFFMMYNILCVGYMFYISNSYSDNIFVHLENSFLLIYGSYSPGPDDNHMVWVIYVVSFIINNWMILNFMIAVYSDIFEVVSNNSELEGYKTKAFLAYEVEVIMTWSRDDQIIQNSEYSHDNKEEEYKVLKSQSYLKKIILRNCRCRRKPDENNLSQNENQTLRKEKKFKQYLHVCKGIDDQEEIDEKLDRLKALGRKIKKAIQKSAELSNFVRKTVEENEKIIYRAKKITNTEVDDNENKGEASIKQLTSRILMNLIVLALNHNGNIRKKARNDLEENLTDILKEN